MAAKRVFVSHGKVPGSFLGKGQWQSPEGFCLEAAKGLGGDWRAWLALEGKPAVCKGGPWVLLDGTVVGNCADLNKGALKSPINVTEQNAKLYLAQVWTGANADGSIAKTCDSWTAASPNNAVGTTGITGTTSSLWSNSGAVACTGFAHVYCFEQ
jgi:hypothetical protein